AWRMGKRFKVSKPASTRMGCFSLPSTNRKDVDNPKWFSQRRSTVPIYMKYGDISGDVTTDGYKGWIELSSAQLGVSRQMTSGAGGAQRESSAPSISEIVITKVQDASSPQLFRESVGSRHGNTVQIKFGTTSKN